MERIALYFNCDSTKPRGKDIDGVDFKVTRLELINNNILPFLLTNHLRSSKSQDFSLFYEATKIRACALIRKLANIPPGLGKIIRSKNY
jgi:hypothetical protein